MSILNNYKKNNQKKNKKIYIPKDKGYSWV